MTTTEKRNEKRKNKQRKKGVTMPIRKKYIALENELERKRNLLNLVDAYNA